MAQPQQSPEQILEETVQVLILIRQRGLGADPVELLGLLRCCLTEPFYRAGIMLWCWRQL